MTIIERKTGWLTVDEAKCLAVAQGSETPVLREWGFTVGRLADLVGEARARAAILADEGTPEAERQAGELRLHVSCAERAMRNNLSVVLGMRSGRPVPLKVDQAALYANMSPATIRRAIREGELKSWRRGRLLRVLDVDLDSWILDRGNGKETQ